MQRGVRPASGAGIEAFEAVSWPGRVVFGVGALGSVPKEVAALGLRRVLLLHGRSGQGAAAQVRAALGEVVVGSVDEVRQHVPADLAADAATRARQLDADGVVTIGGGAATGLGKAVALETGVTVVAVPTTYAGSEMTPIYGITGDRKRTGRDVRVLPRTVVYDPELTIGLSPSASAASGMNAMAQAVEARWASARDPVATLLAHEAIRVLAASLPRVVVHPDDLDVRSDALYGAFLAGSSLARVQTGLHHRLCHAVGGRHDLPHAATHAVLLPHLTAFNAAADPGTGAAIARSLGADDPAEGLDRLNRTLGNPRTLAELGLPRSALEEVAEAVATSAAGVAPRSATPAELLALLRRAFDGEAPTPR
jgi:maleylacetate reductase